MPIKNAAIFKIAAFNEKEKVFILEQNSKNQMRS